MSFPEWRSCAATAISQPGGENPGSAKTGDVPTLTKTVTINVRFITSSIDHIRISLFFKQNRALRKTNS
jgi:hypothetical protein